MASFNSWQETFDWLCEHATDGALVSVVQRGQKTTVLPTREYGLGWSFRFKEV